MIRERSKAWNKYRQNSSGKNFEKYKQIRNKVNRCIRQEENQKRKRILKGFRCNPKRFYGYMRQMQSVKDSVIALKKDNGEMTKTDQETADLLSSYFKQVFTVEDTANTPTVTQTVPDWEDTYLKFSTDVVKKKLQQLKTDKSPGPDNVRPLLKECATVLAKPLSLIFQQSYESGTMPDEWRTAHIVPIFKKGNRTDPANYRPVSLPCKIMEAIIKENLVKFWEDNDTFCNKRTTWFHQG